MGFDLWVYPWYNGLADGGKTQRPEAIRSDPAPDEGGSETPSETPTQG